MRSLKYYSLFSSFRFSSINLRLLGNRFYLFIYLYFLTSLIGLLMLFAYWFSMKVCSLLSVFPLYFIPLIHYIVTYFNFYVMFYLILLTVFGKIFYWLTRDHDKRNYSNLPLESRVQRVYKDGKVCSDYGFHTEGSQDPSKRKQTNSLRRRVSLSWSHRLLSL